MAYKGLQHFIAALESAGELVRVTEPVSPRLEVTEIVDRLSKNNGPALLFTRNGTDFPILINAFGSERRICMALGLGTLDEIRTDIGELVRIFLGPKESLREKLRVIPGLRRVSSWMPKRIRGKGACQEVVMDPPDLGRLPVLTCWPADGGPFITLPCVHTKDPETGARNVGMYRMQVFGPALTGMHWHLHKDSAAHFRKYRQLRKRMPVTVTLGGDPAYIYAATAPLPPDLDEYLLAGFLRKKRVELVRCLTNDLEVPADADFVIEGYVDPEEELLTEGPFGDHTGYYSLQDFFPAFHVTCITHRRQAVYPATIVGIPPQEDGWIGRATEKIFLEPIRLSVAAEVTDMHMPVEGVFHNLALVSIRKEYPGQAIKVMNALWGAGQMMFNKVMAVVDEQVRTDDYYAVLQAITERVDPERDIYFTRGPVDILDHSSSAYAFGSKLGIDATGALPGKDGTHRDLPPIMFPKEAIPMACPEITLVNDVLAARGYPVLILGVDKREKEQCRHIASKLTREGFTREFKFILFTDPAVALMNLSDVTWAAANNLDPVRDCFYVKTGDRTFPVLFLDGTRKSAELDEFGRDWPNVIVMDDETIRSIDKKWEKLGLGPLFTSPSNKYKSLKISNGAVVTK
jgi:4-hydroxy-3-polyprenylbenzoate decarboxylase